MIFLPLRACNPPVPGAVSTDEMTRLLKAIVLGLVLAFCLPAHAGKGSLLEDERLEGVKAELKALFERIGEEGLPGPLFEAKVREGLVKKVPPEKILGALGTLEKRCLEAKTLLETSGLKASPGHIGSVSQALEAGVSKQDAARLLAGLSEVDAGKNLVGKSVLVVVMMREGGTDGAQAVDRTLAIVESGGEKGLDEWIKENSKSAKKDETKANPGKKKPKAKGKAPGKSHGSHGK